MLLPDRSFQKSFIKRKGTAGMSRDMLRAFATSSFHMSYQHSRFKSTPRFFEIINSAKQNIRDREESVNADARLHPDVLAIYDNPEDLPPREVNRKVNEAIRRIAKEERQKILVDKDYLSNLENVRLKNLLTPPDSASWQNFLSGAGFMLYMSAPASAIVNSIGSVAMGLPVVGARFGYAQTAAVMSVYSTKFVTNVKFKDANGAWQEPSLLNTDTTLTDVQKEAYKVLAKEGLFDFTLMHDVRNMKGASSKYTDWAENKLGYTMEAADKATNWAMDKVSYPFHVAEKFNREVVGMSSFDLAYARYIKKGFTEQAAFRKAIDDAKELTYKSMFDYSEINAAPLFQKKYLKPFLMFKKFAQESYMLMFQSFYEANWRALTPDEMLAIKADIKRDYRENMADSRELSDEELNAEANRFVKTMRSEAQKTFLGIFGISATVFAGVMGTPFWDVYKLFGWAYNLMFGDKDELWDPETSFKNWLNDKFGGFVGNSISTGIVGQLTNLDLHSRMSLAPSSMLFRDLPRSRDQVDTLEKLAFGVAGAVGSMAMDMAQAAKLLSEGHTERAIEKATPAFLRNIMKAWRIHNEGVQNLAGSTVIPKENISTYNVLSQALGFTPTKIAEVQRVNAKMKGAEMDIMERKKELESKLYKIVMENDTDNYNKVIQEIIDFSMKHPGAAITGDGIKRSIIAKEKGKIIGTEEGGVYINPKLYPELSQTYRQPNKQ